MSRIPFRLRRTRGWVRSLALLLSLSLGLACTARSASTGSVARRTPRPAPAAASTQSEIDSFVRHVNDHRVSIGLPPLIWHRGLASVARGHSKDMVARHFFSHTNPDGLRSRDRARIAGITYAALGENIAYGHATGTAVLAAWLKSSGHRHNIEDPTYTHHGVGKVGTHWTHVFLRPRSMPTAAR